MLNALSPTNDSNHWCFEEKSVLFQGVIKVCQYLFQGVNKVCQYLFQGVKKKIKKNKKK